MSYAETKEAETSPVPELTLVVSRAEAAADGIQLFEFRDPEGDSLPAWTAGAHLAVRVPSGAMRNYSLCNDPHERDRYVIAVKREEQGRGGSTGLIDNLVEGGRVIVQPPLNLFELVTTAPRYIFIAGGIGITPILSMIRFLRASGDRPFHLYYLTRHPGAAAFLSDLAAFGDQVTLHYDEGDLDRAFDLWPVFETPSKAHVYCCGPRPLMDAVRDMSGHWPETAIHFEDFGSDLVRPRANDFPFTIQLGPDGPRLPVPVGTTILETLRAHGRVMPSSCESGTCGTCRTAFLAGEPDHRDLVLTEAERLNTIMICVSRAKTNFVVLDL